MALAQREGPETAGSDVNNAAEQQVTEKTLDWLFDATWQELEDGIDAAIDGAATAQATSKGEPDDMLAEVVETVGRSSATWTAT
jgi:hypothetical protein